VLPYYYYYCIDPRVTLKIYNYPRVPLGLLKCFNGGNDIDVKGNFLIKCKQLSIKVFLKITRISIAMVPDRNKTISTVSGRYHDNTSIIMAMILDVLSIPNYTKFVSHC
jgi:hypothetical protein